MTFRVRFAKYGVVKFIGHLDVMRYFQKVIRRSELPVRYSNGFNPHQLLSFAQPLGVGITSDGEYMEIEFIDEKMIELAGIQATGTLDQGNGIVIPTTDPKDAPKLEKVVYDGMKKETYEGFDILAVKLLPPFKPNTKVEKAMSLVSAADYAVSLKDGYDLGFKSEEELLDSFNKFMDSPSIVVTKKSKKTEKEVDLKPYVYKFGGQEGFDSYGLTHADSYESGQRVFLKLAAGSVINIRPELIMEAFMNYLGREYNVNAFQIHRLQTYLGDN